LLFPLRTKIWDAAYIDGDERDRAAYLSDMDACRAIHTLAYDDTCVASEPRDRGTAGRYCHQGCTKHAGMDADVFARRIDHTEKGYDDHVHA